jgi:FMN-dependent oxidoreductase (nitrilotriacetate monooxygenase family)
MPADRKMSLGAFVLHPPGHHVAGWRYPDSNATGVMSLDYYRELAGICEGGKLDFMFLADELAVWDKYQSGLDHSVTVRPEPLTLLSALIGSTSRLGLAATVSTTYHEPFNVARSLASLDHLSGGRAAWNLVTSAIEEEAYNFGKTRHMEHDERYERAREFWQVACKLWDSWDDDALVMNKETAIFADREKVRHIDHKGKHFSVRGPLNVPRPPQGHPVVFQAGASPAGRALATELADVTFVGAGAIEEAKKLYGELKRQVAGFGRDPDGFKVMPGVMPFIGRTLEEAEEKEAKLLELVVPRLGIDILSHWLGHDVSQYPLDGPLPALPSVENYNGNRTRYQQIHAVAERDSLTIAQSAKRLVKARGIWDVKGTPAMIADQMEAWFREGAADGFVVMSAYLPGSLRDFATLVVPELQRRGVFRTEYTGKTLRENLGLARPPSLYAR